MSKIKTWSDADEKYLRTNWKTQSASEIGKVLGKTRGSVIGKVYRLDLPPKEGGHVTSKRTKEQRKALANEKYKKKMRGRRSETGDRAYLPKPEEHYQVSARPPERVKILGFVQPPSLQKLVQELRQHECRFPYGDGPFTFCAQPTHTGDSYCPYHNALTSRRGKSLMLDSTASGLR